MKRLITNLALLSILLISTGTYANYITPGTGVKWNLDSLVANSGGNVTFSSGNYMFNDTVFINTSDTISILNNATMKFAAGVYVDVNGVLIVNPPDSAKITAQDTATKFLGLRIDSSNATVLRKLIFEYGNAIRILDCSILIDSCIIRYNTLNSTFSSSAISVFRSNSTISNCRIFRNRRSAIAGGGNIANSPQIINNIIFENDTENANVPQINIGATNPSVPLLIRGNTISGLFDMSGGIAIFPIGSAPNVIIENNWIRRNRYGIVLQGGNINAVISGNIIDSNNIQNNPNLGGSGINLNGAATNISIIKRNIIRSNLWGITIQGTAKPNLGNINNLDTSDNGLNHIYNNSNTGTIYDLYNNTPDSIWAENNYWGTTIIDSVEAHIFHKPDDGTLGFVDYLPIRTVTSINENQIYLNSFGIYNAYPNPFNPQTKINFSIPLKGKVIITAIDITGKEIDKIFNQELNPGTYSINWKPNNLPAGVYFISMRSGIHTSVKKVMLVK